MDFLAFSPWAELAGLQFPVRNNDEVSERDGSSLPKLLRGRRLDRGVPGHCWGAAGGDGTRHGAGTGWGPPAPRHR